MHPGEAGDAPGWGLWVCQPAGLADIYRAGDPVLAHPHCLPCGAPHACVQAHPCSLHSMVCVHPRMFSQASSLQSLAFAGTTQGSGLCWVWSTGAEPGVDTAIRARHWAECEMTLPDIPLLWHRAAHPSWLQPGHVSSHRAHGWPSNPAPGVTHVCFLTCKRGNHMDLSRGWGNNHRDRQAAPRPPPWWPRHAPSPLVGR